MTEKKTTEFYAVAPGAVYEAVVVHCSQGDLQPAFEKFIEGKLGLAKGKYFPIVVPGGAGRLCRPEVLPKDFKFMKEGLELLVKNNKSIKRIILINHEDCAFYKSLSSRVLNTLQSFHAHLPCDDLKLVQQVFVGLLSHLGCQLELYYAKFANEDHTQVTFEKIV